MTWRLLPVSCLALIICLQAALALSQKDDAGGDGQHHLMEVHAEIVDDESLPMVENAEVEPIRKRYLPNWKSLDSRPLPKWFDEARIGIFIHFGVFSVPSYISEWFWCYWQCPWALKKEAAKFIKDNYPPDFTYQDFARDFKLEFFNATEWVQLFERAGAKYAVLTSKHHEGYTMWPSKYSYSWNSVDVGPRRDIVGEFTEAVRNHSSLRLGLYHSYYEWFNPLGLAEDSRENGTTRFFPRNKAEPELYELVNSYKPDLVWSDGAEGPEEYWNSTGFLAWLYNDSPVREEVIVNDRWADGTSCEHGGYFNCADRYNPGTSVKRKWENAMTLDKYSWGYRRNSNIEDYMSIEELLRTMAETVSNGGNLLVNVGPTKEGFIPAIMQERLHQMGDFLAVNGEAIYGSKMWRVHNDSTAHDIYYTTSRDRSALYAIMLKWPQDGIIVLSEPEPTTFTRVSLLGHDSSSGLAWKQREGYTEIWLPDMAKVQQLKHAWVLKITGLALGQDHGEEEHDNEHEGEHEEDSEDEHDDHHKQEDEGHHEQEHEEMQEQEEESEDHGDEEGHHPGEEAEHKEHEEAGAHGDHDDVEPHGQDQHDEPESAAGDKSEGDSDMVTE